MSVSLSKESEIDFAEWCVSSIIFFVVVMQCTIEHWEFASARCISNFHSAQADSSCLARSGTAVEARRQRDGFSLTV